MCNIGRWDLLVAMQQRAELKQRGGQDDTNGNSTRLQDRENSLVQEQISARPRALTRFRFSRPPPA
jgi:hypothetical protein